MKRLRTLLALTFAAWAVVIVAAGLAVFLAVLVLAHLEITP